MQKKNYQPEFKKFTESGPMFLIHFRSHRGLTTNPVVMCSSPATGHIIRYALMVK